MKKAVVLLSGGVDSCVALAYALSQNRKCQAISFDYGQRHKIELESAKAIASYYGIAHTPVQIDSTLFSNGRSYSLLDIAHKVERKPTSNIPSTYVPCRNLLFLSHAACFAEVHNASEIYFAANADDYENYPDCRHPFVKGLEAAISQGSPHKVEIITPLIEMTKKQIGDLGRRLNAPLEMTWSCYAPQENKQPCGTCQACALRKSVF